MKKMTLSCRDGYDRFGDSYRTEHDHLDSFDWSETKTLLRESCPPGARLLEAGCGDGRIFRRLLPEYPDMIGCDVSANLLSCLRKKTPDARVIQADILTPPFRPAVFDAVLAFFLLVHIPELSEFFSATAGLLRKDGLLLCNAIPQRTAPVFGHGREKFVIRSYDHSFRETCSEAEKAGFILTRSVPIERKGALISTLCVFSWPYAAGTPT
jgi:ubiquinone/menaquinone biosynthesis C-methylase UbiE